MVQTARKGSDVRFLEMEEDIAPFSDGFPDS